MRLLNIWTLQFKEFSLLDNTPPYAIASHRWNDDEITYKDFVKKRRLDSAGHGKVERFCAAVGLMNEKVQTGGAWKAMGFDLHCDWIWIDTACINKTDSVELSTSINSMFTYYQKSSVCYAHLPDVRSINDYHGAMLDFMQSAWFTRGWTLQELLAPRVVVFFTKDWEVLGHKCGHEKRLCDAVCKGFGQRLDFVVSRITGIPLTVIQDYRSSRDISTTTKMSWVRLRNTTRPEDRAYCLLGICEVYLVPIYGEGDYAWTRLQAAIADKKAALRRVEQNRIDVVAPLSPNASNSVIYDYSTASELALRSKTDAVKARTLAVSSAVPLRSRTDGEDRRLRELRVHATPFVPINMPELPGIVEVQKPSMKPEKMVVPSGWRTNRSFYEAFNAKGAGYEAAELWVTAARAASDLSLWLNPDESKLASICDYCGEHIFMNQRTAMCSNDKCSTSLWHQHCSDGSASGSQNWYCWHCRESPYDLSCRASSDSLETKTTLRVPLSALTREALQISTVQGRVPVEQNGVRLLTPVIEDSEPSRSHSPSVPGTSEVESTLSEIRESLDLLLAGSASSSHESMQQKHAISLKPPHSAFKPRPTLPKWSIGMLSRSNQRRTGLSLRAPTKAGVTVEDAMGKHSQEVD